MVSTPAAEARAAGMRNGRADRDRPVPTLPAVAAWGRAYAETVLRRRSRLLSPLPHVEAAALSREIAREWVDGYCAASGSGGARW